jgi:hypothetical protein
MLFNEQKGQEFIFCSLILSLTSDEQRVYVQPRRGLGPGAGPGPGQGICCFPRTSLQTVTALPCVFLLLVASKHDPARRQKKATMGLTLLNRSSRRLHDAAWRVIWCGR